MAHKPYQILIDKLLDQTKHFAVEQNLVKVDLEMLSHACHYDELCQILVHIGTNAQNKATKQADNLARLRLLPCGLTS